MIADDGLLETEITEVQRGTMPEIKTKITMNIGNPQLVFDFCQLPNAGVDLAWLEFIINNNIGVHPKAILDYPNVRLPDPYRTRHRSLGISLGTDALIAD